MVNFMKIINFKNWLENKKLSKGEIMSDKVCKCDCGSCKEGDCENCDCENCTCENCKCN